MLFSPISVKYDSYNAVGIQYEGEMGKNTEKFELDLGSLERFEIINYNGNMINEFSLAQILMRATALVRLNLSNIEVFLDPQICNKILSSIF